MAKTRTLDDPSWITPKQALELATAAHGPLGGQVIMEHIRGGVLPVSFSRRSIATNDEPQPEVADEPGPIPASYWPNLQDESTFWSGATARFYFRAREPGDSKTIRLYGIKFLGAQVEKLFPKSDTEQAVAAEAPIPSKGTGGAPRAEHWDDLIIAMMLQMWEGDLQPQNQEAVQNAILDWGIKNHISISESAAKSRAKKLFKAYKSGVKN